MCSLNMQQCSNFDKPHDWIGTNLPIKILNLYIYDI